MRERRRVAWAVLALVAVAALAVAHAEIIEQVLVKVNGEIFTKTELEARQVALLRQRGQQLSDEELKKAIADLTPQLLVDTIDEMLLLQRGKDLGYKMTEDQFKRIVDNIKKENRIESDEQLDAALKAENMTMADLRSQLERAAIINEVQRSEIYQRITITEAEAKAYYDRHAAEFTTPATITARELLVSIPTDPKGVNAALDEEARAKAERLRARALGGESFEKLVAEASDSSSKTSGGLVGPISENDIDPTLRTALDPMKVGDISEVLRTQRGYLLLKLETKSGATVLPFEQVREEVGNRVGEGKSQGETAKYVAKLRAQAIIEWKSPELKKLYEKRLAELAASPASK
jgi:peptidyl-prolyl cis-trans isomerase SurA